MTNSQKIALALALLDRAQYLLETAYQAHCQKQQ